MERPLERALCVYGRQAVRPVLEVLFFRLARLHGRHGNRSARIDRHELQPSLPHAILGEATHDASVEGGGRVGGRRIKLSKNFSHGSLERTTSNVIATVKRANDLVRACTLWRRARRRSKLSAGRLCITAKVLAEVARWRWSPLSWGWRGCCRLTPASTFPHVPRQLFGLAVLASGADRWSGSS